MDTCKNTHEIDHIQGEWTNRMNKCQPDSWKIPSLKYKSYVTRADSYLPRGVISILNTTWGFIIWRKEIAVNWKTRPSVKLDWLISWDNFPISNVQIMFPDCWETFIFILWYGIFFKGHREDRPKRSLGYHSPFIRMGSIQNTIVL